MNEFDLVTINTHQVFLGLLLLFYTIFFVFVDGEDVKVKLKRKKSFFIIYLLPFVFAGLVINFLGSWNDVGIFFSIEFALLIVLSIVNPKYAIGFLVYLLLSRPWETYDNQLMQSMPRDISYLAMVSIIGHKIINKEFFFKFNTGTVFLGGFALWLFLSAFFSNHQALALSLIHI